VFVILNSLFCFCFIVNSIVIWSVTLSIVQKSRVKTKSNQEMIVVIIVVSLGFISYILLLKDDT